jgi:hypothetical protein
MDSRKTQRWLGIALLALTELVVLVLINQYVDAGSWTTVVVTLVFVVIFVSVLGVSANRMSARRDR